MIFVHGCFWHNHEGCRRATIPNTRSEYWIPKLIGNVERDKLNSDKLQSLGLKVLVIWECQTSNVALIEDLLFAS